MSGETVLLADDEPLSCEFLAEALAALGLQVTAVADGTAAIQALGERPFDYVFTDLVMPGADGLAVLAAARRRDPHLPVVLVTAHGTLTVAVRALREGADDILEKPVAPEAIELALHRLRARGRIERENRWLRQQQLGGELVASGPAMQRIVTLVERVAQSSAAVLIRGESGTGKERVAALLHQRSDRAGGPYVKLNCAAVAESLAESEFFGHEAGAFTGATKARAGLFEIADGGTLFLDEVAELTPALQAKLLRVLQDGEVVRVGGHQPRRVDVRIVAATNRDLPARVAAGEFREDLWYRLAVVLIEVPPLRARADEIVPLAKCFLPAGIRLGADAEAVLLGHAWPGNVRELQNVLQRAALLASGSVLDAAGLRQCLGGAAPALAAAAAGDPCAALVGRTLHEVEAELILRTLAQCGGNRTRAAEMLGIGVRTLFNRLRAASEV